MTMKEPFFPSYHLVGASTQIRMRSWIETGGILPITFLYMHYFFSPTCF